MYNATDIAKYLIQRCKLFNYQISNLQLQKILYYIQGYFLALLGRPAFSNDVYAWKLGPVVPEVYYEYNFYGASSITKEYDARELLTFNQPETQIMDYILIEKIQKYVWDLVGDTHKEDPWKTTTNGGQVLGGIISQNVICDFFSNELREK